MIGFFCAGCNFTSQSYNCGKLLDPGASRITIGVGERQFYTVQWRDSMVQNAVAHPNDTTVYQGLSVCWDYRLGILRKLPFGQGLEIGFHLEGPVQFNPTESNGQLGDYVGLAIIDLDARCGFADAVLGDGIFHHNAGVGWTIGAWIDNGWYGEYAAGWEYKWLTPYVDVRAELLATDPMSEDSLTESYTPFKYEKRSWTTRTAVGLNFRFPVFFPHWPKCIVFFIPNCISPEVSVVYPNYSAIRHYGITYHIGLGWIHGM